MTFIDIHTHTVEYTFMNGDLFLRVGRGTKTRSLTLSPKVQEVLDKAICDAWVKVPAGPTGERGAEDHQFIADLLELRDALKQLKD